MASGVVAWLAHPRFCSDFKLCTLRILILACWALTPIFSPRADANLVLTPVCSSSSFPVTIWLFVSPTWHWPPKAPGWFKSLFSYPGGSSCSEEPLSRWSTVIQSPSLALMAELGSWLPKGWCSAAPWGRTSCSATWETSGTNQKKASTFFPFFLPHPPSPSSCFWAHRRFSPAAQGPSGGQVRMPWSSFQLEGGDLWRKGWFLPGCQNLPSVETAFLVDLLQPGLR